MSGPQLSVDRTSYLKGVGVFLRLVGGLGLGLAPAVARGSGAAAAARRRRLPRRRSRGRPGKNQYTVITSGHWC